MEREILIKELENRAKQLRRDIIQMLAKAGSGHPGGSLSAIDIINTLYFGVMRHNPKDTQWPDRDRFVLSKGHGCPAWYAVLGEAGYFDKKEFDLLRTLKGSLQGHPERTHTPGVEMTTGSLGQGLSAACGMALAGKLDKRDYRVFCMIGCGESQEGQIWEAAMSAVHLKLDNLCVFTDFNGCQIDGCVEDIMSLGDIKAKWSAFGWHVIDIDGHSYSEILKAVDMARNIKGKPTMIIAKTVKGKGVSFMENKVDWHGVTPNKDQTVQALQELEK